MVFTWSSVTVILLLVLCSRPMFDISDQTHSSSCSQLVLLMNVLKPTLLFQSFHRVTVYVDDLPVLIERLYWNSFTLYLRLLAAIRYLYADYYCHYGCCGAGALPGLHESTVPAVAHLDKYIIKEFGADLLSVCVVGISRLISLFLDLGQVMVFPRRMSLSKTCWRPNVTT